MTRYAYENAYLMLIEDNGRRLVNFDYDEEGRVGRISLADRRSYRLQYECDPQPQNRVGVCRSFVTGPDGSVTKFEITFQMKEGADFPTITAR